MPPLIRSRFVAQSIKSVVDTSEEEFWKMLDINLVSVFRGIKLAVPYMKKRGGGAIVNTR